MKPLSNLRTLFSGRYRPRPLFSEPSPHRLWSVSAEGRPYLRFAPNTPLALIASDLHKTFFLLSQDQYWFLESSYTGAPVLLDKLPFPSLKRAHAYLSSKPDAYIKTLWVSMQVTYELVASDFDSHESPEYRAYLKAWREAYLDSQDPEFLAGLPLPRAVAAEYDARVNDPQALALLSSEEDVAAYHKLLERWTAEPIDAARILAG